MGNCASSELAVEAVDGFVHAERACSSQTKKAAANGLRAPSASTTRGAPSPQASSLDIIPKLEALQQELALISTHPLLALAEAAEIVASQTGADAVAIYVFATDEPGCAAMLAADGAGAAVLERSTVVRGGRWTAVRLAESGAGRLMISDARQVKNALPRDLELMHSECGLCSFMAAAIGTKERPRGVLVLGKRAAGGFDDSSSPLLLGAAATGLLQHVRPPQVAQAVRMMRAIDDAGDPVSAISALLQGAARYMWHASNLTMGVRLALIESDSPNLLLFESRRADEARLNQLAVTLGDSVVVPEDPAADVSVREMGMGNTLLSIAVSQRRARFIKDVASYYQNCSSPARDVFTHASQEVSSLVVVPLLVGGKALGGLYMTQEVPCDFSNVQETVLGLVHSVTLTLWNKLAGKMPQLKSMVQEVEQSVAGGGANSVRSASRRGASMCQQNHSSSDPDEEGGAAGTATGTDDSFDGARDAFAARLSKVSSRQLCTEGMLKVLQQQIRKGRRRSSMLSFQSNLVIHEPLGRGGFGHVYRGTWHTAAAAIKVMNARSSDSEAVSDAMEMAVLSSVQHPNIVQVYCCLTNMVEVKDAEVNPSGHSPDSSASCASPVTDPPQAQAGKAPRYRRALPGEDLGEGVQTYNIVVMEYCDRGTLKEAVRAGAFHRPLEAGSIGVDLLAVVNVLLDVAHSLQYIHRMHLLHSDIKLDNVLLKSDASRPMGVTPKLADFGLAKILKDTDNVINHSGAGTVTHLAPEMFVAGSRVTTGVDVYAFGIMMWEFYTQRRPYAGLSRDQIVGRVLRGARPVFPAGPPAQFVALATACWAAEPHARPAIEQVILELQMLAAALAAR